MARTVKVDLVLENMRYVRGAREAARATGDVKDSVEELGRAGDKASKETDRLGGEVSDLAADARRLDAQVDDTARGIRELAREIAHTSDEAQRAKLTEKLLGDQSKLRGLTSLRKLLDFDDDPMEEGVRVGARFATGLASGLARAGGPISSALSSVFGGLPPQAQAAIGAGVVGAVTAAAPAIGGVLAGAVVGAAGVGGIVGGVALAARHPAVQAAAKLTGDTLMRELERGAVSFVPATVESLGIVRSEIGDIGDDLERAFSAAAPMLEPLTRDVLAGAEAAVEGFATAVERSGPVVRVLGDIAREAGDLIGDTFVQLSESAYEGGRAVAALWGVFEFGTRTLVGTVSGLAEVYGLAEKFGALLIGDRDKLVALIVEEHNAKAASGELSGGMQILLDAVNGFGGSAATAAVEVETLNEALKRLTGENITAEQANIRLEEAIDRATEAGRKNNAGIDTNTAKGRENRTALLGIAEAANTSYDAILEQTGSTELASVATERGRKKFLEAADAMGVEKGEALRLANQLFAIPEKVDTKIKVTANTQPALDNARGVVARINNMHARIRVSAEPSGGYGGSAHTGDGYSTGYRWGGITPIHARDGLLSQASVFTAGARPLYAFAEPETGQEAFVPRNGDPRRSLAILGQAAGWYGAALRPRHMAGMAAAPAGGGTTVINRTLHVTVNVPPSANPAETGRRVVEDIRAYERNNGAGWRT